MVRLALTLMLVVQAFAQKFESASIQLSGGGGSVSVSIDSSAPNMKIRNAGLRDLIRFAYEVRDFQIAGGPDWINSDRYDIVAKAAGSPPGREWPRTMGILLRSLLEDRFKLKLHKETQQLPVYALTVSKSGLELRRSKMSDCPPFRLGRRELEPGERPSACSGVEVGPNLQLNQTLDVAGMRIDGGPANVETLMTVLSREVDRMIINKTGLSGLFDIRLEWNRQATREHTDEQNSPSIFTAVERQLGLKLEPDTGPVEVLVIDRAERPAQN